MHQGESLVRGGDQLDSSFVAAMLVGLVAMTLVYAWLLVHRFRLEQLEERLDAHALTAALDERRREGVPSDLSPAPMLSGQTPETGPANLAGQTTRPSPATSAGRPPETSPTTLLAGQTPETRPTDLAGHTSDTGPAAPAGQTTQPGRGAPAAPVGSASSVSRTSPSEVTR